MTKKKYGVRTVNGNEPDPRTGNVDVSISGTQNLQQTLQNGRIAQDVEIILTSSFTPDSLNLTNQTLSLENGVDRISLNATEGITFKNVFDASYSNKLSPTKTHGNIVNTLPNNDGRLVTHNELANISLNIKGVYNNNGEAKTGGLVTGDYYRKPIVSDAETSVLAVVVDIPPFMKLSFNDIDTDTALLGISDKTNISDWNSFFSGKGTDLFDSVIISGNIATFYTENQASIVTINLTFSQLINFDCYGLNSVYELKLGFNSLTSFNPTSALSSSLYRLWLNGNQIVNFNPAIALPISLKELVLSGNQIVTFNPTIPLPAINLLELLENQIVTFNPTIPLPEGLEILWLNGNQIVTFNPTIALPSTLTQLYITGNQIINFDPSIPLPNSLLTLHLQSNQIITFDPTIALPASLTDLTLSNNQIATFDPTIALPASLDKLYLNNNILSSFNPTIVLPSLLTRLILTSNDINTFDPTIALPSTLEFLFIESNGLVSFNTTLPLPASLNYLKLTNNALTVFNPTQPLPDSLQNLDLKYNNLTSFNLSYTPSSLIYVTLEGNPITTAAWNTDTTWISPLTTTGQLLATGTADTVTGTATETLLLAKGWTIITQW